MEVSIICVPDVEKYGKMISGCIDGDTVTLNDGRGAVGAGLTVGWTDGFFLGTLVGMIVGEVGSKDGKRVDSVEGGAGGVGTSGADTNPGDTNNESKDDLM